MTLTTQQKALHKANKEYLAQHGIAYNANTTVQAIAELTERHRQRDGDRSERLELEQQEREREASQPQTSPAPTPAPGNERSPSPTRPVASQRDELTAATTDGLRQQLELARITDEESALEAALAAHDERQREIEDARTRVLQLRQQLHARGIPLPGNNNELPVTRAAAHAPAGPYVAPANIVPDHHANERAALHQLTSSRPTAYQRAASDGRSTALAWLDANAASTVEINKVQTYVSPTGTFLSVTVIVAWDCGGVVPQSAMHRLALIKKPFYGSNPLEPVRIPTADIKSADQLREALDNTLIVFGIVNPGLIGDIVGLRTRMQELLEGKAQISTVEAFIDAAILDLVNPSGALAARAHYAFMSAMASAATASTRSSSSPRNRPKPACKSFNERRGGCTRSACSYLHECDHKLSDGTTCGLDHARTASDATHRQL